MSSEALQRAERIREALGGKHAWRGGVEDARRVVADAFEALDALLAEVARLEQDRNAAFEDGLRIARDGLAEHLTANGLDDRLRRAEAALAVARKREQRLREAGTALLVWADDPSYAPLDDGSYRDVVAAFRAALVDGPAAASGVDAPARCSGCGKVSERRPLGQTPDGWMRGRSKPGDDAQGRYWCPECVATLAEPEDEVTTSLGNADERGGRRVLSRGSSGSASAAADELNRIADRIIADHGETLRKLAEDD